MPADPRLKQLFADAADLDDPAERAALLDRECGDAPDLRRRVEELLRAHDQPASALEQPFPIPKDSGTRAIPPADGTANRPTERTMAVGDRIGPYKLLEKIGEGGMGEVWVADQQEPIKRRVALKLIKPGMDSRSVLGRFEAERQALAVMDHPHIAKVFEAGTTADGRPYFVMELVKGTPITEFADARKLTPKQRLELFVPVCQAIQHAHMKGIIHRDVKPSNVLVELHDDRVVPKVIDFGVAKAVGQQLTEKTIYTGFGALVGTPAYMAPEQATFNAMDIDTRADVYALGVLLYELLAGSPPIEKDRLKKAALDEVLRIVRDEEPPRPSQRLSTSQAKATIAATRGSEPAKLSALMKGELDWIVMKALEKDRTRRYETANGFAADIQRFLAGEQVQAVPPSFGYRVRKLYRRNRVTVLTAALFLLVLTVGTVVSLIFATRASLAEKEAWENARAEKKQRAQAEVAEADAQAQWQRADRERDAKDAALRKSEGLRLATTALLKKPQNHDLTAALAHEAVLHSSDAATVGAALAAIQGLPNPRPFAPVAIPHRQMAPDDRVLFLPSAWVRFHPDGRHVLALNNEHTVLVTFDATTRKRVRTLPLRKDKEPELEQLLLDPRGRWLVGTDSQGGLVAWDATAGTETGRVRFNRGNAWAVAFSADGDRLAVVGPAGREGSDRGKILPHRLVVYSLPRFERVFEFEATELLRCVAFNRDGTAVAVSSAGERVIRAWDLPTKKLLLEAKEADKLPYPALVFSHDGSKLLDVTREGIVAHDLTGKEKTLLKRDDHSPTANGGAVSIDADGAVMVVNPSVVRQTLNTRSFLGDTVPPRVFDLKQLKWGPALETDPNEADVARICPDGRRAFWVSDRGGLSVWDTTTGRFLARHPTPGSDLDGLAVRPDGQAVVTHSPRDGLRLWELDDRGLLPVVEFTKSKGHSLVTGDGRKVVVFRGDGRLETFDAATLRSLSLGPPNLFPYRQDGHTMARVLADGRRVLLVSDTRHEAVLYDAAGEVVARYPDLPKMDLANSSPQLVMTAHEGGARFLLPAAVGKGESVLLRAYDAETGKLVSTIDPGGDFIRPWGHTVSPDGRWLAVIPDRVRNHFPRDMGPEMWNLDTGVKEGKLPPGEPHNDGGQAFDPGGQRLVTWRTGTVAVWDVASREKLREFELADRRFRHAALSADGKRLATYADHELAVWDADTGANLFRLPHAEGSLFGMTFVAGGSMLLVDGARGWSTLDLYPLDLAAHLRGRGVRRLTDRERIEYGLQVERRP